MTKDVITDVLFEGRFYEWWWLKEGTGVSPSKLQNISKQVCLINNNRALIIARNVLLVDKQEI